MKFIHIYKLNMSGFEVRNSAGSITVNSSYASPRLLNYVASPRMGTTGDWGGTIPDMGKLESLAYLEESITQSGTTYTQNYHKPGQIMWFRLAVGAWGLPGADYFIPGKVNLAFTRMDVPVESGYLDVFDSSGKLIWSAKSAATTPRIIGFINVPAGYDLLNKTLSVAVPGTPFFPSDMFPGLLSETWEGAGGRASLAIKQQSGSVLLRYDAYNNPPYTETPLYVRGFKIPYAIFPTI
ncbi:hypothetical protein [Cronobacter sakazakii]|uniref:hypothetical protein n=1 Tax=Cronobacter sakazakii TaxID=28141 RepID=UPI001EFC9544|nr:hypothetical protein [Cronobacter sakazakii]